MCLFFVPIKKTKACTEKWPDEWAGELQNPRFQSSASGHTLRYFFLLNPHQFLPRCALRHCNFALEMAWQISIGRAHFPHLLFVFVVACSRNSMQPAHQILATLQTGCGGLLGAGRLPGYRVAATCCARDPNHYLSAAVQLFTPFTTTHLQNCQCNCHVESIGCATGSTRMSWNEQQLLAHN